MKVYRINRQGRLPIPKEVRINMSLLEGELLDVYISSNSKYIIIEPSDPQSQSINNQCIYFQGRITIPKEIRNILKLTEQDLLRISNSTGKLIVKKVNEKVR
ncbi:hypothetical protein [Sutcliffiella cohnii]|uniref:hypothetical protein n=1 Tax=Sutcliffiella cohnii TaxID=33932 RepID=UPI002E1E8092|nr:hypothetical protein [Sutcliffiella cohnii]